MSEEYIGEEWTESEGKTVASDLCDVGKRADAFLAEQTDLTRSAVVRLIETEAILVNGKAFPKNYKIRQG